MTTRHIGLWVTLFVLTPTTTISAASVRTQNFIVEAPSPEMAQEFAKLAEHFRKQKALEWLGREMSFPNGAMLLTGTGIVPPDAFTLASGDVVRITIDGIGTLTNTVG